MLLQVFRTSNTTRVPIQPSSRSKGIFCILCMPSIVAPRNEVRGMHPSFLIGASASIPSQAFPSLVMKVICLPTVTRLDGDGSGAGRARRSLWRKKPSISAGFGHSAVKPRFKRRSTPIRSARVSWEAALQRRTLECRSIGIASRLMDGIGAVHDRPPERIAVSRMYLRGPGGRKCD